LDVDALKEFIHVHHIVSNEDSEIGCDQVEEKDMTSEDDVILQFRIWEQGRVDMEDLIETLQLMAQHALWEVVTEHLMMPNDIMALLHIPGFSDDPIEKLHYEFQFFTKDWFEVGLELKVVSLTRSTAEFISHHTTLNSMKELQHQINMSIHDIKTKAFQLGSYRDPQTTQLESIYLSCNTHGLVPSIAEDETSKIRLHDCYILLGRNFKHWNACLDFETSEASELAPREMRPLQRFQPLVVSSTCEPGDTSRSASSTPTQTSNFSPTTTSSVTEDSNSSYMTQ
jgi:hypothetical protein